MGKNKIPNEIRLDIENSIKYTNESMYSIAKRLGVSTSTVYSIAGKLKNAGIQSKLAPIPAGFKSIQEAYEAAITCHNIGFDSDYTGAFCRANNVNLVELKEFYDWAVVQNQLSVFPNTEVDSYKARMADFQEQLNELAKSKNESDQALAEYAKRQLIKDREAQLSIELLKKAIASFSQKD